MSALHPLLNARGRLRTLLFLLLLVVCPVSARQWPYDRYQSVKLGSGGHAADFANPTLEQDSHDHFTNWLRGVVEKDTTGELKKVFKDGRIPPDTTVGNLMDAVQYPPPDNLTVLPPGLLQPGLSGSAADAAAALKNLGYPLDKGCIADPSSWFFRTYDGSCNWIEAGSSNWGKVGTAKSRDYGQTYYKDGISQPREGPNARAVSNAFFKRKDTIYYEHTPLLIGLIEFIMHDVTWSKDSNATEDQIEVIMPDDEQDYPLNMTLWIPRTTADPKTGTSTSNPRQILNQATTWLDLSALYGSTKEVALKIRSMKGGKLLAQRSVTPDPDRMGEYLPFNTPDIDVPLDHPPNVKMEDLFAGGDPRTNEDWILLGIHTLLLREHNRLCDILAKQYPAYDDERLYQTVRVVLSAKYALIANSYQMAYWTDEMPWPRDDGYPLYRQMYGQDVLHINPANTYPWPLVSKGGKPMIVSTEMAVLYRFHEFIISEFPLKDAKNRTIRNQDLFETVFNARGFVATGLEPILRGSVATSIPNFKSGVDEAFRSAGSQNNSYKGKPFDIVTWSIIHEREQGLPTFNNYFRSYNEQNPNVKVRIRERFEDFTSDPKALEMLEKLYNRPDDVDLVVGVQLEEDMFPGTTVPRSALIVSLFSLFGMGNSDRFSIGFAMMRCLLVGKPWDCQPSNALEELLWIPNPTDQYPNARTLDNFWIAELDFPAHGTNLLWRLITENTNIRCIQQNPLFPADPTTNPVLCQLPSESRWHTLSVILVSGLEFLLALWKQGPVAFFSTLISGLVYFVFSTLISGLVYFVFSQFKKKPALPVLSGWPILGVALGFKQDPLKIFSRGMDQFKGKVFGMKLASLTHYVVTRAEDFNPIATDKFEVKFSLHEFLRAINFDIITLKENFETDLHTKLIRAHLGDPVVLRHLAGIIDFTAKEYFEVYPLIPEGSDEVHLNGLNNYFSHYIAYIVSRCMVGPFGYDDTRLLEIFLQFNNDAVNAMGFASLLPKCLQFLAGFTIRRDFSRIRNLLIKEIGSRRSRAVDDAPDFMNYTIKVVDDDQRVADLIAIATWGGLTNLQSTFSSSAWDIINTPGLQKTLDPSNKIKPEDLSVLERQAPWDVIRSAVFESIRLCGPVTGPARVVCENYTLPSERTLKVPKKQVVTLSSYYTHRQADVWGQDAARYVPDRFAKEDPPIGSERYITWGLQTPHLCPGLWFGLQVIEILVFRLFATYSIVPDKIVADTEKYKYSAGNVVWKDVGVTVKRN